MNPKPLTKKDYDLIRYALEILSSDYETANKHDGTQEPYRVKMQREIIKLEKKLTAIIVASRLK